MVDEKFVYRKMENQLPMSQSVRGRHEATIGPWVDVYKWEKDTDNQRLGTGRKEGSSSLTDSIKLRGPNSRDMW